MDPSESYDDLRRALGPEAHLRALAEVFTKQGGELDPVRHSVLMERAQEVFPRFIDGDRDPEIWNELRELCPSLQECLRLWSVELGPHVRNLSEEDQLFFHGAVHLAGHLENACWVLFPDDAPGRGFRNGDGSKFLETALSASVVLMSRPEGPQKWWQRVPQRPGGDGES